MRKLLIALTAGLLFSLGLVQPAGAITPQHTAAARAPFPGLKTWDLLVMSDSSNWGVGAAYAKLIAADQHVKVRLHDCWIGDNSVRNELSRIRFNSTVVPYLPSSSCTGRWQQLIREAEVIVVYGNPVDSRPPNGAWDGPNSYFMFVEGTYQNYTGHPARLAAYRAAIKKSCAPTTFTRYKADLGALYDTIFKLRGGRPVIMRETDFYIPIYAAVQMAGLKETCRHCFENGAAAVHQAAKAQGVPVASSFDALNGKDHQSDAATRGYIQPDGIHLSFKGAQLVAKALRQTGYAYAGR